MPEINHRLQQVYQQILLYEQEFGRNPNSVKLLAVSKTRPATDLLAAHQAGQVCFGESYLQEALEKIEQLRENALEWHFIGPVQSNKTRDIATHFDWVHSVDRLKIARRLSEQRPEHLEPLPVLIQVNSSDEQSKSGCQFDELEALAMEIATLPRIRLRGLMTIPARSHDFEQQRIPFRKLRNAQQQLIEKGLKLDTLSMGMSNDMRAAIAEGATIVRIGTAIFGARN